MTSSSPARTEVSGSLSHIGALPQSACLAPHCPQVCSFLWLYHCSGYLLCHVGGTHSFIQQHLHPILGTQARDTVMNLTDVAACTELIHSFVYVGNTHMEHTMLNHSCEGKNRETSGAYLTLRQSGEKWFCWRKNMNLKNGRNWPGRERRKSFMHRA